MCDPNATSHGMNVFKAGKRREETATKAATVRFVRKTSRIKGQLYEKTESIREARRDERHGRCPARTEGTMPTNGSSSSSAGAWTLPDGSCFAPGASPTGSWRQVTARRNRPGDDGDIGRVSFAGSFAA